MPAAVAVEPAVFEAASDGSLARLERELEELRTEVAELRASLRELREPLLVRPLLTFDPK